MAARGIDAAMLRTVHVVAGPEALKALYLDEKNATVRPNLIFVDPNGAIIFETNEAGLKGDPLDRTRKLAVVWGDSIVFGSGRGWAFLLDRLAPGWQFLNGGIEGDLYTNILRRAGEFNRHYPVALNLLMLGWHPFVPLSPRPRGTGLGVSATRRQRLRPGNRNIRADLTRFLERTPNTVVLTMPTALNEGIIDRDLSSLSCRRQRADGFPLYGRCVLPAGRPASGLRAYP
jgi:hypothetical protein